MNIMNIDSRLLKILDASLNGQAPSKHDCLFLLEYSPESFEAGLICAAGDFVTRKRFRNEASLMAQIGVSRTRCAAGCRFCAFGVRAAALTDVVLSAEEVDAIVEELAGAGNVHTLFIMTTYNYEWDALLELLQHVRGRLPAPSRLGVTIGDFDAKQAQELRAVGVESAYHVCRLREGQDTFIPPDRRLATIEAIKEEGLHWHFSCEPIGPEHTNAEILDALWIGLERGCYVHGAMRRVPVPGSSLEAKGQITERRLAQITAVIALCSVASSEIKAIAVQAPSLLGLCAGANSIVAEKGTNARFLKDAPGYGLALSNAECVHMLWEAGFSGLRMEDQLYPISLNADRVVNVDGNASSLRCRS